MREKTVLRCVAILMLVIVFATVKNENAVFAASATLDFSVDAGEVRVGDIITVTLTVTADMTPGDFTGYISYNDNVLNYVTGSDCIAGGEGILKINDIDSDTSFTVKKYELYFKAAKIGTCDIAMMGTTEIYDAENGQLMSVSTMPLSIEVTAAQKASSDATLASLKINPGTLSPNFSSTVYEYNVSLPYEAENLVVSAGANSSKATVKIEGNTALDVGQNRILILVTAEDGSLCKYVIYAARAEAPAETPTPAQPEDANNQTDTSSSEGGQSGNSNSPEASGGAYFYVDEEGDSLVLNVGSKYAICENDGSVEIPEGYTKTSIVISGYSVTAYADSVDVGSDYMLLLLSKDGGAPALYSFDRVEKTIQRYSRDNAQKVVKDDESGMSDAAVQELVNGYEKSLSDLTLVVAILCGVCMLLLILTVRIATKSKSSKNSRSTSGSGRSGSSRK